ncbi:enoyl-CoA hydratase-related protein, partial [Actinomadura adrarensis]
RAAKSAMRRGAAAPLDAALDIEENAWRTAVSSPDRREGIAAFNEKRKPNWPS